MIELINYTYDELSVGLSASMKHIVTLQDIQGFAAVSHDVNPAHLDADYAAKTVFKEVIAHGMLSASYISAVIGTKMPGPGTIYLHQDLNFLKPVYIGSEIEVIVTVLEKLPKHRVVLTCQCFNQNRELVCEGIAKVLAPKQKIMASIEVPKIAVISANYVGNQ
jgi:phosphate acetyltransferase